MTEALSPIPVAIFTPSYRNDFELAADLCRSIDAHLKGEFTHILIVPSADLPLFRSLQGPHRKILAEEDVVKPYGFFRLPIPTRIKIPGVLNVRIREQWWKWGAGRLNGWLLQQILKLSAPDLTDAETLLFIDSDVELFRDFTPASLWHHDCLHLQEHQAGADRNTHTTWRETARRLLGADASTAITPPMNYIGNLITWRRSRVLMMQAQITKTQGMDWRTAIARNPAFSEYITYGLFCREVLAEDSGHVASDAGLYNSVWTNDGDLDETTMIGTIRSSQVALHIQSTIPLALEKRRALLKAVSEHSRTQSQ